MQHVVSFNLLCNSACGEFHFLNSASCGEFNFLCNAACGEFQLLCDVTCGEFPFSHTMQLMVSFMFPSLTACGEFYYVLHCRVT